MTVASITPPRTTDWTARHLAALIAANVALALGPWFVRLSDSGPVSAGFWRLFLPLPILFALARANRQPLLGHSPRLWWAVIGAGVIFAADIASWHIGIGSTRLGNATLFGNSGSLIVMAWGLVALRRAPNRYEWGALLAAVTGTAILLGRSLQIGAETLIGDLFCLLAGFFYAFYILLLKNARSRLGNWSLLAWSSAASVPVLLGVALLRAEPVWPHAWWPLIALALCSQVIGQGLLVYSLRHFSALFIGLALLTQPAIAVLVGWLAFGETMELIDLAGAALVTLSLFLVSARSGQTSADN